MKSSTHKDIFPQDPGRAYSGRAFLLPSRFSRAAEQALGEDSHPQAARVQAAAAQAHRAEERYRDLFAGRSRAALCLRFGADSRRFARRRSGQNRPGGPLRRRPGAPAAPPNWTATRSTICSKPRPRTSRPRATKTRPRSRGTRSRAMRTRFFRSRWTCFCTPSSARKSSNWPSSRKPRELSGATTTKERSPRRESAKLVYGANSPYTRQPELATIGAVTVDDLEGLARPHHWRQADRRHQRRL